MDFDLLIMAFSPDHERASRMPSSLVVSGSVFAADQANWRTIEGTINEKEVIGGMVDT
jgi:hypothetical protein